MTDGIVGLIGEDNNPIATWTDGIVGLIGEDIVEYQMLIFI